MDGRFCAFGGWGVGFTLGINQDRVIHVDDARGRG